MIGFKELLIVLVIALVVFGAKRLRTLGSDLGGAVKGFKDSMRDGEAEEQSKQIAAPSSDATFDSTPASKAGSKSPNAPSA